MSHDGTLSMWSRREQLCHLPVQKSLTGSDEQFGKKPTNEYKSVTVWEAINRMLVEFLGSRQPKKEEHVGGGDLRHYQIGMRRSMSASQ